MTPGTWNLLERRTAAVYRRTAVPGLRLGGVRVASATRPVETELSGNTRFQAIQDR